MFWPWHSLYLPEAQVFWLCSER